MLGNPVSQAFIRPHGSPAILGDFRVTATFGQLDSDHPTPHTGVDIGNGKCGEPLLAMSDAKITFAGKNASSAALIIGGTDPLHPEFQWLVAHCATITVKLGQQVHRGDRIGTLGMTGATACHCHIGLKRNGTSIDVWPYLDQNQVNEVISAPIIARIVNRQCSGHAGVKFRADPSTTNPELLIVPLGTVLQPDFSVTGALVAGTATWYTAMFSVNGKLTRGYFHESTVTPLVPIEAADCSDAVTKATAPLLVKIDAAKGALA